MKPPAFQWYPGDFRRDTAVQACEFEVRALWREMIDLMHDGEPYGHLTAGGVEITVEQLARIVGKPVAIVRRWLKELEDRNVFSRTDTGVIYSRRMVRDHDVRRKRAAGGKLGGNPALMDKGKDNLPPNLQQTPAVCSLQSASATESVSNETGAAAAPPPVENVEVEQMPRNEWLGYFMPILRECGYDADDTDGSILKALWAKQYDQADTEAAIRGVALMKKGGRLTGFGPRDKLSMRLLYYRPKPNAPPERRPLWNEAVELYHRDLERNKRSDPNKGNDIASILGKLARPA